MIEELPDLSPEILRSAYDRASEWLAKSQSQDISQRLNSVARKVVMSVGGEVKAEQATEVLLNKPCDLQREVSRFANGLKALGVRKGDRVGIYMPLVPEAAMVMRLGASTVRPLIRRNWASARQRQRKCRRQQQCRWQWQGQRQGWRQRRRLKALARSSERAPQGPFLLAARRCDAQLGEAALQQE